MKGDEGITSMTHTPKDIFKPIEERNFDTLISTIAGSNNRSKVQAVKKALWAGLFLEEAEAEWLYEELKHHGFRDPA